MNLMAIAERKMLSSCFIASDLHNELCMRGAKLLRRNGLAIVFYDRFQASNGSGEFPGVTGNRNGSSCLIEVKVSRSDFLADKKKPFRKDSSLGMGDWRFYLCPPGVIKVEDLEEVKEEGSVRGID